jgi:hypothetical protein
LPRRRTEGNEPVHDEHDNEQYADDHAAGLCLAVALKGRDIIRAAAVIRDALVVGARVDVAVTENFVKADASRGEGDGEKNPVQPGVYGRKRSAARDAADETAKGHEGHEGKDARKDIEDNLLPVVERDLVINYTIDQPQDPQK